MADNDDLLQELSTVALNAIADVNSPVAAMAASPVSATARAGVAKAAAAVFAKYAGTDDWSPSSPSGQLDKRSARAWKAEVIAKMKADAQPVGSFFVVWILPVLLRLVFSALWNWWFSSHTGTERVRVYRQMEAGIDHGS